MNKKPINNGDIKNLRIQVLYNTHPNWQETIAFYRCNGVDEQHPFFIKRIKGASSKYYIEETKKQLFKSLHSKKKVWKTTGNLSLKHLILASAIGLVCGAGIGVGATYAIVNTGLVKVTFNAGLGKFNDGSRIKTVTVPKGTKIVDIPHDYSSMPYSIDNITTTGSGIEYLYCTTKSWVTDKGIQINEVVDPSSIAEGDICLFADFAHDLSTAKSIAIGEIANKATEAIARQPEATDKILNTFRIASDWIDNASNGFEILAIGESTAKGVEAIARQPEADGKIRSTLVNGYAEIHNMPADGRNIGLGMMLGQGVEGIARQPEALDKIQRVLYTTYESAKAAKTDADGYAMGLAASLAVEGTARQPEADGKILNALHEGFEYINNSDDMYESLAIGETTAGVAEAIARQPEAEERLLKAATITYNVFHAQPNDGRVDGLGEMGNSISTSIARQPEAENKICNTANMVFNALPLVNNPLKGRGLGHAGAMAVEGVARQPEAETEIRKALYFAIQKIIEA